MKSIILDTLSLDEDGRIVLSDDALAEISQLHYVTSAGGANQSSCVNSSGCTGSTNQNTCHNTATCDGSTNRAGCENGPRPEMETIE